MSETAAGIWPRLGLHGGSPWMASGEEKESENQKIRARKWALPEAILNVTIELILVE